MKLFVQNVSGGSSYMIDETGDYVALLYSDYPKGAEAARLMASAPELLEALEFTLEMCYASGTTLHVMAERRINEAISKAKGEL